MISFSAAEGYICKGLSFSPITGGDGNIEFLLHLHWPGEGQEGQELPEEEIMRVVEEAHKTLKEKKQMYRNNRALLFLFSAFMYNVQRII